MTHYWYPLQLDIADAFNTAWQWPPIVRGQIDNIQVWTPGDQVLDPRWMQYFFEQTGLPIAFAVTFIRPEGNCEWIAHADAPVPIDPPRHSTWAINWSLAPDNRKQYWFDLPQHHDLTEKNDSMAADRAAFYSYPLEFDRICDSTALTMQPTLIRIDTPHWVGPGLDRRSISLRCIPDTPYDSWEWAVDWFTQRGLLIPR